MLSRVPILLYHSVSTDPPGWIAPFSVHPATFEAHLDAIVASGLVPVTVSQYLDGLQGTTSMPDRPVLITFDDGFADFADRALPALIERNMASTLYVTTGALAGPTRQTVLPAASMLSRADLPGLESAGVEIGAHSHTHRQLDRLPQREAEAELTRSGDELAAVLGHRVRSFAYPHGYYGRRLLRQVAAAGFDSACTVANALSGGHDHPLALSRLMVYADTDLRTLTGWLGGAAASRPRPRLFAYGWRQCRRLAQRQQANGMLGLRAESGGSR
jgi:peptidoglycan/xylan/chitin deacetylase (PgdA/CDA1 family)